MAALGARELHLDGGVVIVDADFKDAARWRVLVLPRGRRYVVRTEGDRLVYLHRHLLGLAYGDGRLVDHANGNGLDNRRANLRIATQSQNMANQASRPGSSSSYKGVTRVGRRWQAQIMVHKRNINLGCYTFEIDAARAYARAAVEHFGEFARIDRALLCVETPQRLPRAEQPALPW